MHTTHTHAHNTHVHTPHTRAPDIGLDQFGILDWQNYAAMQQLFGQGARNLPQSSTLSISSSITPRPSSPTLTPAPIPDYAPSHCKGTETRRIGQFNHAVVADGNNKMDTFGLTCSLLSPQHPSPPSQPHPTPPQYQQTTPGSCGVKASHRSPSHSPRPPPPPQNVCSPLSLGATMTTNRTPVCAEEPVRPVTPVSPYNPGHQGVCVWCVCGVCVCGVCVCVVCACVCMHVCMCICVSICAYMLYASVGCLLGVSIALPGIVGIQWTIIVVTMN